MHLFFSESKAHRQVGRDVAVAPELYSRFDKELPGAYLRIYGMNKWEVKYQNCPSNWRFSAC